MKKNVLLFAMGLLFSLANAQNTLIPNNDFEGDWSFDTCYVFNDVGDAWIDDTVQARSEDAADGNFSLYLKNSGSNDEMDNNVAYVLWGDPDNYPELKGVPYDGDNVPDSIYFSYKANMQGADSAEVWVFFFKDGAQVFSDIIHLGSCPMYADTAFQLNYSILLGQPDSVLLAFASGNVMGEGDTDGNEVWFDNVYVSQTDGDTVLMPHGHFEDWEMELLLNVEGVETFEDKVEIFEDVPGNNLMKLTTRDSGDEGDRYNTSFTLWGEVEYDEFSVSMSGGLPLPGERNMLSFRYKYVLADAGQPDTAEAILLLYNYQDSSIVMNNVYLLPTDTFMIAHIWYEDELPQWNNPDSIAVVFRSSMFRFNLPPYSLENNELYIDDLIFQSEAQGAITIDNPDTMVNSGDEIVVRYLNSSGSNASQIYSIQDTIQMLNVDFGQEGGAKIIVSGAEDDSFYVYVADYYNASIIDSFGVKIGDVAPQMSGQLLDEMPDPSFENWFVHTFDFPISSQTRNNESFDTSICVEKGYFVSDTSLSLKLTTLGLNALNNNISYVSYSSGNGGMGPLVYMGGGVPNSICLSYQSSMLGDEKAEVWVHFYKNGNIISEDIFLLPEQLVFGEVSYPITLSGLAPDSVLVAYASGDVMGDGGTDGSFIIIDDVYFKQDDAIVGAPLNGDFESWDEVEIHESEGMSNVSGVVRRTEDASLGQYAMTVMTQYDENSGYPYYSAVNLWGEKDELSGLRVSHNKDQLVFSYKYLLKDNAYPDTAMASLQFYDDEGHEYWSGTELLATDNQYHEMRISYDSLMQGWGFSPSMMSAEFSSSKYRANFESVYSLDSNVLYVDDLYWHSEAACEITILTPDTTKLPEDPLMLRFFINGSRSNVYNFYATNSEGDFWYVDTYYNEENDYKLLFNNVGGEPGDKFMLYMSDYYNDTVYDSVLVTIDTPTNLIEKDKSNVQLFPNPITNSLTIDHLVGVELIKVFDMTGNERFNFEPKAEKVVLDFSLYPRGIYYVQLSKSGHFETRVVVK